ncbi:MAG: TetR/AcrR family transcriptional regulator [Planctomycetota bacterium]
MPRPRSLPEDEALEVSLRVFWSRGYDRTSIADLSAALGLGPSSIYNAFGSKEELFRRAIDRYVRTYVAPSLKLVAQPSELGVVELMRKLMRSLVRVYTAEDCPPGCAIFQGGSAAAPADSVAAAITQEPKAALLLSLRRRFTEYAQAGAPLASPPRTLALVVLGTLSGISQLACDGVPRAELLQVADHVARGCVRSEAS